MGERWRVGKCAMIGKQSVVGGGRLHEDFDAGRQASILVRLLLNRPQPDVLTLSIFSVRPVSRRARLAIIHHRLARSLSRPIPIPSLIWLQCSPALRKHFHEVHPANRISSRTGLVADMRGNKLGHRLVPARTSGMSRLGAQRARILDDFVSFRVLALPFAFCVELVEVLFRVEVAGLFNKAVESVCRRRHAAKCLCAVPLESTPNLCKAKSIV